MKLFIFKKSEVRFFASVICFFSASLFTAVGLHYALGPESQKSSRGPASAGILDENGDELYAHDTIEDLERNRKNLQGYQLKLEPILSQVPDLVSVTEATENTGVKTTRVRKMKFNQNTFLEIAKSQPNRIQLALFKDVDLRIQLRPSNYGTNSGVFSGQVIGDPSSRVDIFVGSGDINATIETAGRRYRILTSGRNQVHYVLEEQR